ncbi:transcription factor [Fusarium longipes]|uniref:Transcription factor n=1 Tax=Fusarium longipes TaxID=694270 RepID=A0A395T193_9HYPO|nr:transcription factor [Fusarium longipes]
MSGSRGLGGSIWATGGRSRLQESVPPARASSQPSSRPTKPPPSRPAQPAQPAQPPLPSASAPLASSVTTSTRLTSSQALHRFEQACHRLRWKYVDLQNSYQRALHPDKFGFPVADAERNFKVDFHEFYVWIEQAIVLLLLVFDISVPHTQRKFGERHTYHEDVINALEELSCPLFDVLGRGETNMALRKAKELRNRWKDASDGKETPPLKMYDLTWVVGQILTGLEAGHGIGAKKVDEDSRGRSWADDFDDEMVVAGDNEWEWMVEPMDWESVGG